jgi:chorismate mutase / prephenate dehydratase
MDKRSRLLVELLEQYLDVSRRDMLTAVNEGAPTPEPARLEVPDTVHPSVLPHLQNAIRRLNEVFREQAYADMWRTDPDWELGRRMRQAMGKAFEVTSVAFLGKPGSHSHRSARQQYPHARMLPVGSFADACRMVMEREADAAVLPMDNSTAGTISDVYDLLQRQDLHIVRGASLSIRNVLLGVPGASVAQLREVWTHPQPIMQCAGFLRANGLRTVAMESTAVAAEAVARNGDASVAAIGSREAAALYGLQILEEEIDDMSSNQTRFVTVARELVIAPDASRLSLVFNLPHESGALSTVLSRLADFSLNVAKIQSRPIPQQPWAYSFHLDFESRVENNAAYKALYLLDHDLPYLKLLGWYADQSHNPDA